MTGEAEELAVVVPLHHGRQEGTRAPFVARVVAVERRVARVHVVEALDQAEPAAKRQHGQHVLLFCPSQSDNRDQLVLQLFHYFYLCDFAQTL